MVDNLLGGGGLRYNGKVIDLGAQTKRLGDAGPVKALLARRTSPANSFCDSRLRAKSSPVAAGVNGHQ
jgi:hypothetical protein